MYLDVPSTPRSTKEKGLAKVDLWQSPYDTQVVVLEVYNWNYKREVSVIPERDP